MIHPNAKKGVCKYFCEVLIHSKSFWRASVFVYFHWSNEEVSYVFVLVMDKVKCHVDECLIWLKTNKQNNTWLCPCRPLEGLSSFLWRGWVEFRVCFCFSWLVVQHQVHPSNLWSSASKPLPTGSGGVDVCLWIEVDFVFWRSDAVSVWGFPAFTINKTLNSQWNTIWMWCDYRLQTFSLSN